MRSIFLVPLSLALSACTAVGFSQPLEYATNRATPLGFGLHVSPDSPENPIDPPERFSGYHAAIDYEVTADELNAEVPVFAICSGDVIYSGFAEGYGGLVVQRCTLDGEPMTVLYGHVSREGLVPVGTPLSSGERMGVLAAARSVDTDGNRKHLHLGMHRGERLDVRGYVQNEDDLREYINPTTVLPQVSIESVLPNLRPYWQTATGSTAP